MSPLSTLSAAMQRSSEVVSAFVPGTSSLIKHRLPCHRGPLLGSADHQYLQSMTTRPEAPFVFEFLTQEILPDFALVSYWKSHPIVLSVSLAMRTPTG